jgi:hypothetical protein
MTNMFDDLREEKLEEDARAIAADEELALVFGPPPPSPERALEIARMSLDDYYRTPEWQTRRRWALEVNGRLCAVCGSTKRLDVHHNTYKRLGHERLHDLVVLCRAHHQVFHAFEQLGPGPIATDGPGKGERS